MRRLIEESGGGKEQTKVREIVGGKRSVKESRRQTECGLYHTAVFTILNFLWSMISLPLWCNYINTIQQVTLLNKVQFIIIHEISNSPKILQRIFLSFFLYLFIYFILINLFIYLFICYLLFIYLFIYLFICIYFFLFIYFHIFVY